MAKATADNLVDVGRVAQEFGCSERQVQLFVQAGMPKAGHGKYDLLPCYRWYMQKLKKDLSDAEDKAVDLEYEQMRERRATADIKELELAEKRGLLIPLPVFKQEVSGMFITVKQNILALAAKIAPQLEGLDRTELKLRLHKAHREILAALATGESDATGSNDTGQAGAGSGDCGPTDAGSAVRTEAGEGRTAGTARTATRCKPKRVGRTKSRTAKGHK